MISNAGPRRIKESSKSGLLYSMSSETQAVAWERQEKSRKSYFVDPESVFADVQEILGRKWHPRIIYYLLEDGPLGFSGLKDRLNGISSKMLSESLSSLEEHGLVARQIVSDQPVRVEYSLTERGVGIQPVLNELFDWSEQYGLATEEER